MTSALLAALLLMSPAARAQDDLAALAAASPLLLIGESHAMPQVKRDLARRMKSLRKAGVTHLGLEMFGSEVQETLTAMGRGRLSRTRRGELDMALRQWGWDPAPYQALLEAARVQGIRLIALNVPDEQRFTIVLEPGQRELNAVQAHMLDKVDRRMSDVLAEVLRREPKARIVALVGSYHARVLRRVFQRHSRAVLVPDPVAAQFGPTDETEKRLVAALEDPAGKVPRYLCLELERTGYDGALLLR